MRTERPKWKAALALAIALGAGASRASGQESLPVSPSKVERKNRAPVSEETIGVRLPRPREERLANGLSVLILEDHRLPVVFVQLHLRGAGALFDPEAFPGLASATAQMLREGTPGRTSREVAERLDRLGASVGAGAAFGSPDTVVTGSGLSENLDEWLEMIFEVLLEPVFPEDELRRLKERALVQLRQQRAAPRFLASERFHRAVFGDHPAAVVAPTQAAVETLTPELLARWHRERYNPAGSVLAVAGDVDGNRLLRALKSLLARWGGGRAAFELPPPAPPRAERKIYLVDRPGSVQTTLMAGNIAVDRRSDDYIPLLVMNQIIGGGPAGRLFLNLREEKGYTYGAYSSLAALEYPGPWSVAADVRTEVTGGALGEILKEIERMREARVSEAELAAAKRTLTAGFALALEQPARVLGFAVARHLYGLPEDYWERYPELIAAVTADDVQRVARRYLDPNALQVVAVGDGEKIKEVLEKFGPVEVYDSNGSRTR